MPVRRAQGSEPGEELRPPEHRSQSYQMITHQQIDERLRAMVGHCVEKIDADPALLTRLAENTTRIADQRIRNQWLGLLNLPWSQLREQLLAQTDHACALRQNAPFGGLLSNAERIRFFKSGESK